MKIKQGRDFFVFSAGQIFFSVMQFGIIILLNKMANMEIVGTYSLALSITTPIFTFSGMNLRAVVVSQESIVGRERAFVFLRCITSVVAFILAIFYALVFRGTSNGNTMIFLIALYKLFESISDIFYGFRQRKSELIKIAVSMMLRSFVIDVILFIVLGLGIKNENAFFVLPVTMLFFMVFIDFSSEYIKGKAVLKDVNGLLMIALPLGPVMMLNSLNINIPRYFIEGVYGSSQLGIFASISQVVFIGNLLTTSIGTTFSRSISKAFHSGDDKQAQKILVKMIIMVIIIYGLGLLFSVVAGKEILIGLFTEQYSNYGSLLNQIILSYFALALASVTGYFLTALCEYKIQIVAWTLGILVNIIISTQTNRLGLVAGAYGLGFSSLLVFIFNLIWYRIKFLKRGTGQ